MLLSEEVVCESWTTCREFQQWVVNFRQHDHYYCYSQCRRSQFGQQWKQKTYPQFPGPPWPSRIQLNSDSGALMEERSSTSITSLQILLHVILLLLLTAIDKTVVHPIAVNQGKKFVVERQMRRVIKQSLRTDWTSQVTFKMPQRQTRLKMWKALEYHRQPIQQFRFIGQCTQVANI